MITDTSHQQSMYTGSKLSYIISENIVNKCSTLFLSPCWSSYQRDIIITIDNI